MLTDFSEEKMLRERKSADFSTAMSLNSCGEQNICRSHARISTMGLFLGMYVGSELKNITSLKTRSRQQLRFHKALDS